MNHIETLKLALEALEEIALAGMSPAPEMIDSKEAFHARQAWRFIGIAARQLSAIREALAEQPAQQQEPVAWVDLENWLTGTAWPDDVFSENQLNGWTPLYTTPPAAPVQVQTDWEAVAADQAMTIALLKSEAAAQPAQEEIQRLSALVRAQQITIEKLEAQSESK